MVASSDPEAAGVLCAVSRLEYWLKLEASPRALQMIWLLFVLALAAMLRLTLLGSKSLWFDEAFSVHVARFPPVRLAAFVRAVDAHPPGFYLLLHVWMRAFGQSEVALRSLSVAISVGTVLLSYLLGRAIGGARVGLIAALLTGVSPFQVMAAQEVRMYPLLGFLSLLCTYFLWKALETGQRRFWGGYVAATAAMLYVHYFGFLVLGFHGSYLLVAHRRDRGVWAFFGLALILVALLYVPWLPSLLTHVSERRGWAWFKTRFSPFGLLINTLTLLCYGGYLLGGQAYFGGRTLPLRLGIPLIAPFLTLWALGLKALWRDRRRALFAGAYLVAPLGAVVTATLWLTFAYPRYFSFLGAPAAILWATGVEAAAGMVPKKWRR